MSKERTKECPSCAMEIPAKSKECPICGYEFPRNKGIVAAAIFLLIIWLLWMVF